MPLSAAQPGFPELLIAPLHAAVEPCRFETCAGDAVDSAAQSTRAGIADVRLEVFVIEQGVPFSLEIDARDDLAWAFGRAERFDEALAVYLKLIADYERVMGVDDPDTLTARNNYICTLKNSGKIMEAVALYRELLSDVERILGADDEFAQEIAQRLSEWES